MPSLGPIARRDLIAALRRAGFTGPRPGGSHEFMRKGNMRVPLPNPHRTEISLPFLVRFIHEAGLSRAEWESL